MVRVAMGCSLVRPVDKVHQAGLLCALGNLGNTSTQPCTSEEHAMGSKACYDIEASSVAVENGLMQTAVWMAACNMESQDGNVQHNAAPVAHSIATTCNFSDVDCTFNGSMTTDVDDEPFTSEATIETTASLAESEEESKPYFGRHQTVSAFPSHPEITSENDKSVVDPRFAAALFFKTKICKFNMRGECKKGSNCGFAHGEEELQTPPDLHHVTSDAGCQDELNEQELPEFLVKGPSSSSPYVWGDPAPSGRRVSVSKGDLFFKTKMCKFQKTGSCTRGESCRFAHHAESQHTRPDFALMGMCLSPEGPRESDRAKRTSAWREDQSRDVPAEFAQRNCGWESAQIFVRNTFITLELSTPQIRRSASAPAVITSV